MQTQQFYCHYTGKDGHTPRRRLQTLTFIPMECIDNTPSSPTPLWFEVMGSGKHRLLMAHAQLSDLVAVYTGFHYTTATVDLLNNPSLFESSFLQSIRQQAISQINLQTDYTSLLMSYPDQITPPILNAYREARPSEYQQLLSIINH